VGIVADARLNTLRGDPDAAMYLAAAQMGATRAWLVVRSTGDPASLTAPIRHILQAKNKDVIFDEVATMEATLESALADFRVVSVSLSVLAAVALLLTAIGLYGVLAYHVSQRTHELGIRIALGAGHHQVLSLVIRRGLVLVGFGLLIGLAGAYGSSRFLEQLLFETRPLDPGIYLGATTFLGLIALLACLLPAWQAARVDPAVALRTE
jgi:ABC-type antimicrobial peptide transport system permease subunit